MMLTSFITVLFAAAASPVAGLHSVLPATLGAQGDTVPRVGNYRVFTGSGELVSLDSVVAAMASREVVFIGESHDDLTGHHLEMELLSRAFAAYGSEGSAVGAARPVTLSLEMFERDVQYVVDEYLLDQITEDQFQKSSRPWPEYETDYRPLVEFVREHGLAVVAANAPRRYANRVTRLGRDALLDLSPRALETLPPLPYGEPSVVYGDQWRTVIVESMEEMKERCPPPEMPERGEHPGAARPEMPMMSHGASSNPLQAQALWDAAMAFSISEHLMRRPDALVLHMVGSFHVERGTGTPEHLELYRPGASTMIVVIRPVEDIEQFDPERDGENEDFVILTDESLSRPPPPCPGGN